MKKRSNIIVFIVAVSLSLLQGIVSAGIVCDVVDKNSCSGVNVIEMSSRYDAHAALSGEDSYDYVLCCSGEGLQAGSGDMSQEILRLSDTSNAHAERPAYSGNQYYNVVKLYLSNPDVLGFACSYRSSGCGAGEDCIITLSGGTNAHLAGCGHANAYTPAICCAAIKCYSKDDCGTPTIGYYCSDKGEACSRTTIPVCENLGRGDSYCSSDEEIQCTVCTYGCGDGACKSAECTHGDTRPCGECGDGTRTCYDGVWSSCIGDRIPSEEICDDEDNDCDGEIDEGGVCPVGYCGDGTCEYVSMNLYEGGEEGFTLYKQSHQLMLVDIPDEDSVIINVDGIPREINEGTSRRIAGVDCYVDNVWYSGVSDNGASITLGEMCLTCPEDCGECCSNSLCEPQLGENCESCPSDCPTGSGEVCCSGTLHDGDCCGDEDCSPPEICIDYVCDQLQCENDEDGDDYGVGTVCKGPDCDDSDPSVNQTIPCVYDGNSCGQYDLCMMSCPDPPAESCFNRIDDDCDNSVDEDCIEYMYLYFYPRSIYKLGETINLGGKILVLDPVTETTEFLNNALVQARVYNPGGETVLLSLDKNCEMSEVGYNEMECEFSGQYSGTELTGNYVIEGIPNDYVINYEPDRAYGFYDMIMEDWAYRENGDLDLILRNGLGEAVTVNGISISIWNYEREGHDIYTWDTDIGLSPGESYRAMASETGLKLPGKDMGDYYSLSVSIRFRKTSGLDYSSKGSLYGTVKDSGYELGMEKSYPKIVIKNSTFSVYDPAILGERLILEDIDGYEYLDSEFYPYGSATDNVYYAAFYRKGVNYTTMLYEFDSGDNCSEFLDNILSYSYYYEIVDRVIDGMRLYELVGQYSRYNSSTSEYETLNVSVFVWKMEQYLVAVGEMQYYIEYSCEEPTPIIEAYMERYPSDLEVYCGNNICDGDETVGTCPEDCGDCYPLGKTRSCGQTDVGACEFGIQVCENYTWSECMNEKRPGPEICENGIDDNCNGEIDEECFENKLNVNLWLDRVAVTQGDSLIASGMVTDWHGNRISNSTVSFTIIPGNIVYAGETDENGMHTNIIKIGRLESGEYALKAKATCSGYDTGEDEKTFVVTSSAVPVILTDDIIFINMAQILIKMEAIELSLNELKKVITSIVNYYNIMGDEELEGAWQGILTDTDSLIGRINDLQESINEFIEEPSQIRLRDIKSGMNGISGIVRVLTDKIVSVI